MEVEGLRALRLFFVLDGEVELLMLAALLGICCWLWLDVGRSEGVADVDRRLRAEAGIMRIVVGSTRVLFGCCRCGGCVVVRL